MNLNKLFLTKNDCYKAGAALTPKGVMVHSTGCKNEKLSRYVGPDDGKLGVNPYGNHWNQPTPDGRSVCVHAFIGKLADGSIATYQTLPWNMRGWHSNSGAKGAAHDTHIGFEICEDGLTDKAYFDKVYREAVELTAYLCREYKLDPMKDGVVIDHSEGYKRGIASNHGDVKHWFTKQGKSMDAFRADVKAALEGKDEEEMTQEQFEKMYAVMMAKPEGDKPSEWAKEACEAAKAAGVFKGDGKGNFDWQKPLRREALASILFDSGLIKKAE